MKIAGTADKIIIGIAAIFFLLFLIGELHLLYFTFVILGKNANRSDINAMCVAAVIIHGIMISATAGLGKFLYECYDTVIDELKNIKKSKNPLPLNYKKILQEKFAYYNRLDLSTQIRFEKKVHHFLLSKNFVPTHDLKEPTIEMKVLIAASAAQLTLGLPDVYLISFKSIILYASDYINPYTRQKHQGEVNPKGSIVLSWNNFVQGYAVPTNALNLGLHEMAHALKFENFSEDKEYLFIDAKYFHYWDKVAKPIFYQIQSGEHTFLRSYAGSNSEEFFAVCVEYFLKNHMNLMQSFPNYTPL